VCAVNSDDSCQCLATCPAFGQSDRNKQWRGSPRLGAILFHSGWGQLKGI